MFEASLSLSYSSCLEHFRIRKENEAGDRRVAGGGLEMWWVAEATVLEFLRNWKKENKNRSKGRAEGAMKGTRKQQKKAGAGCLWVKASTPFVFPSSPRPPPHRDAGLEFQAAFIPVTASLHSGPSVLRGGSGE